jgi:hypothetical protein
MQNGAADDRPERSKPRLSSSIRGSSDDFELKAKRVAVAYHVWRKKIAHIDRLKCLIERDVIDITVGSSDGRN